MTRGAGLEAPPATDVHWLALGLETLYEHDARGRLVRTREPGARPAPAFALSRSAHGNLWRFGSRLPTSLVRDLSRLASREAPLPALTALPLSGSPPPPERWEAMRRRLSDEGIDPEPAWRGPSYRFPTPAGSGSGPPAAAAAAARSPAVDVVAVGDSSAGCLRGTPFDWLVEELPGRQPVIACLVAGEPVAMAWAARGGGPAPFRAVEAGVETVESQRGRGHGRRVMTTWAARVRTAGAWPLYSTAWSNAGSRALARSLGLVVIGEHGHLGQGVGPT